MGIEFQFILLNSSPKNELIPIPIHHEKNELIPIQKWIEMGINSMNGNGPFPFLPKSEDYKLSSAGFLAKKTSWNK